MNKFFLFWITIFAPCFGNFVEENLKKISLDDRVCMKIFFEKAIFNDQAAHVIFFNSKPVSFTGPALKHSDKTFRDILVLRGWHAFKKHQNLFPHPQYIFSEYVHESGPDSKMLDIFIIKKQALTKCLHEHTHLFENVLGDFDPTRFVEELERGKPLTLLIHHNEMLLGVLLGYGEESSKAFFDLITHHHELFAPPPTETYRRIDLKVPKGCKIKPVVFMGNPHSQEVKTLVQTYESELEQFFHERKKEDFLKTVLEKLCEK